MVPILEIKDGSFELKIITDCANLFLAIFRDNSTPSIIGISKSMKTTSNFSSDSLSIASTPLMAPTTLLTP